ncbi:excalibur calcium-binding domain-containing protein [Arthrobacter sp. NPDC058130]|uniref:excalibur calcium-binding domain-containing protein n=1 Tax=Arthrobacter sp. NPDC058130 TaxID=3346353 RepID=UPI0036E269A9
MDFDFDAFKKGMMIVGACLVLFLASLAILPKKADQAQPFNQIQQFAPGQPTKKRQSNGSYSNCAEARAAGAAPVYSGEPGYGSHLDRDHDGVGCE